MNLKKKIFYCTYLKLKMAVHHGRQLRETKFSLIQSQTSVTPTVKCIITDVMV